MSRGAHGFSRVEPKGFARIVLLPDIHKLSLHHRTAVPGTYLRNPLNVCLTSVSHRTLTGQSFKAVESSYRRRLLNVKAPKPNNIPRLHGSGTTTKVNDCVSKTGSIGVPSSKSNGISMPHTSPRVKQRGERLAYNSVRDRLAKRSGQGNNISKKSRATRTSINVVQNEPVHNGRGRNLEQFRILRRHQHHKRSL